MLVLIYTSGTKPLIIAISHCLLTGETLNKLIGDSFDKFIGKILDELTSKILNKFICEILICLVVGL